MNAGPEPPSHAVSSMRSSVPNDASALVARQIASLTESRPRLILLLTLLLCAGLTVTHPATFPTVENGRAVLLNATNDAIMVSGMMILFAAGAFDLSIGSILSLSGVVAASLSVSYGLPGPLAAACGIGVGAIAGLINGVLVTSLGINPLIVTLGTLSAYLGITELISGSGVDFIPSSFTVIGQTVILGFESPFWIAIIVVAIAWFLTSQTAFFRKFYYIGGNPRAAKLSGIRNERVLIVGFVIMGALAALAGILDAARLGGASSTAGTGEELAVITAGVLGGASLKGGEGTVVGGVLGVLFIALVQNALLIEGVGVFWQSIVTGVALIFAVGLDSYKHRHEF